MAEEESPLDGALTNILAHLESGTGELEPARRLSERLAANLSPSPDLTKLLVWAPKQWWLSDTDVEKRREVASLLHLWARLWPGVRGFSAYRAAPIRQALDLRAAVPESAQEFILEELGSVGPRISKEWLEQSIVLLGPTISEDRAVLAETLIRMNLKSKGSKDAFPDALLESIANTSGKHSDQAFNIWTTSFCERWEDLWNVVTRMEGTRWKQIAVAAGKYVNDLETKERTAFVKKLSLAEYRSATDLLEKLDPSLVTQKTIAKAQNDFLLQATNSEGRRQALNRIDTFRLTSKEARAMLADSVFKVAGKSNSSAKDVFTHFPQNLKDAPGVQSRWKALKKKASPSISDRVEAFRKNILGF